MFSILNKGYADLSSSLQLHISNSFQNPCTSILNLSTIPATLLSFSSSPLPLFFQIKSALYPRVAGTCSVVNLPDSAPQGLGLYVSHQAGL